MTAPLLPSPDLEIRLRDAALILIDLANEAIPVHDNARMRKSSVYSLAVQTLLMAEDLRPGVPIADRVGKFGKCDIHTRILGAAFGVGETAGCLRDAVAQSALIMGAAGQLAEGLNRRNLTMREMGLS